MRVKISKTGLECAIKEGLTLREFVYLNYVSYYNLSKSGCTVANKIIANDLCLTERNVKAISMACVSKDFMRIGEHNSHRFVSEKFKTIATINESQKSDFFILFTPFGHNAEIHGFNEFLIF